jgi:hypothetical protein
MWHFVLSHLSWSPQADLNPRQMAHIDTAENKSLYLQCGDNAEYLAVVNTAEFVTADVAK